MSDHMVYLLLGMMLGVGIPFYVAGVTLWLTGYKMFICKDDVLQRVARS